MLTILLVLLVACIVLWGARSLLNAFGIGDPVHTVVMVIVALLVLIYVLKHLGLVNLAQLGLT